MSKSIMFDDVFSDEYIEWYGTHEEYNEYEAYEAWDDAEWEAQETKEAARIAEIDAEAEQYAKKVEEFERMLGVFVVTAMITGIIFGVIYGV